jgi:lysophospholipase L1-like esterase
VIALGSDQNVTGGDISRALKILGPNRKLGLVTPRETGGGESNDATVIRNAGARYPERVKVLDWVHYSAGHGSWFQPDGLHLTFSGAKAFARLLKKLIPLAATRPPKKERRAKP